MITNMNITPTVRRVVQRPLLTIAILLLIISSGVSRQVYAVAFEQTREDISKDHYNMCKNRLGPQLTREQADKLDANCQEIVQKPLSPEEKAHQEIMLNQSVRSLPRN